MKFQHRAGHDSWPDVHWFVDLSICRFVAVWSSILKCSFIISCYIDSKERSARFASCCGIGHILVHIVEGDSKEGDISYESYKAKLSYWTKADKGKFMKHAKNATKPRLPERLQLSCKAWAGTRCSSSLQQADGLKLCCTCCTVASCFIFCQEGSPTPQISMCRRPILKAYVCNVCVCTAIPSVCLHVRTLRSVCFHVTSLFD